MSGTGGTGLTEKLLSWTGVAIHLHWFGGVEFQLNGKAASYVSRFRLGVRVLE